MKLRGVDFYPKTSYLGTDPGGSWLLWSHTQEVKSQVDQQLRQLRQIAPNCNMVSLFLDYRILPYGIGLNNQGLLNLVSFTKLANSLGFRTWLLIGTHMAIRPDQMSAADKALAVSGHHPGDMVNGRRIWGEVPATPLNNLSIVLSWYSAVVKALAGLDFTLVLCGSPFLEFATEIQPETWAGHEDLKPINRSFWAEIARQLKATFPSLSLAVSLMPRFAQGGDPCTKYDTPYSCLAWGKSLLASGTVDFIDLTSWPCIDLVELLASASPDSERVLLTDFSFSRIPYDPRPDMYSSAKRQREAAEKSFAGWWVMGLRDHGFPDQTVYYEGLINADGTTDWKMVDALGLRELGPTPSPTPPTPTEKLTILEAFAVGSVVWLRSKGGNPGRLCINARNGYALPMWYYCSDLTDAHKLEVFRGEAESILRFSLVLPEELSALAAGNYRVWVCNDAGCTEYGLIRKLG